MSHRFFKQSLRLALPILGLVPILIQQKHSHCMSDVSEKLLKIRNDELVLVPGRAHVKLAQRIAENLNLPLAEMDVTSNLDGELSCLINTSVNGKEVFIIQPCACPVNDSLMELMLTISCAKRAGARRVTAVVPYFGYRYHRRGQPLSTKHHSRFIWSSSSDFAQMLSAMGVDRIISVDLHRVGQDHEACFFEENVPVESVSSVETQINYVRDNIPLYKKVCIVSSSSEYIKKSRQFQDGVKKMKGVEEVRIASFLHDRDSLISSSENLSQLLGDVDDCDVIITDDVVETAGTMSAHCRRLIKQGARNVYLCASHGLFSPKSMELITLSPIKKVIVSDSLPLPPNVSSKVVQVSVADALAKIIEAEFYSGLHKKSYIDQEEYKSN